MCSTRRYGHSCGERIVKAETLEGQLMDWIRAFHPDGQLHDLLLHTVQAQTAERRKLLLSLFEQIWAQNGRIVAVQPHDDFLPYFQATQQFLQHQPAQGGAESGSDGGRGRTLPPGEIEVWRAAPGDGRR